MKSRFIILLNNPSKEQDDAFLNFIKVEEGFGYWHWISGAWLLYSSNPHHTSEFIRNKIMEMFPGLRHVVLQLSADGGESWHGFGPSGENKNMYKWLRQNWTKD